MHVFQDFKFDFEEFDGGAHDGNFGIGDKGGGNETHGFDGVFGNAVFDILVDERAALNDEASGPDAGNLNTELFEEETNILNHVVRRSADDGGLARGEGGGHEDVFGDGVATLGENDVTIGVFMKGVLPDFDFVEAAMAFGIDGEAEGLESLEMRLDGASAKGAAAGVGDAELGIAVEEGP